MSKDKYPDVFKGKYSHLICFKYKVSLNIIQSRDGLRPLTCERKYFARVSPQFSTICTEERSLVEATFNMAATSGEVVFRAGEVL